jgi:DNA-binding PadR family transcriptional regulator
MPAAESDIRLTPTSYIVLGLVAWAGDSTPYDLKRIVARSVGNFWSVPHAQLYREPRRLAQAGYLDERIERGGRRRKHYSLTAAGRRALREWLAEPTEAFTELRDPGLLKLFFGADPAPLAGAQLPVHEERLATYRELHRSGGEEIPAGARFALESGIGHEREWVRFWRRLAP